MTNDKNAKLNARIKTIFEDSARVKNAIANDQNAIETLRNMADISAKSIKNGGKIMLCGNGGSAGDAQHITAELLVRLRPDCTRAALPAITLAMDTSTITACSNDFSYEQIFERPLRALSKPGDVLIGISTSGNSKNVIQAMKAAIELGVVVIGFLGKDGGPALEHCDHVFIPTGTTDTGRIQESHITAGHALVEMIEENLGMGKISV